MQYPQLPVAAFLAAALVLIPTPWHWRARNIATCGIIFWLFVVNFIYGVNSILWASDVIDRAPIWCDICTKIVVGASFALPICTMCVCKHLEMVSSNRKVKFDHNDKRRRVIFESVMCFVVPLVFMALHYIVQGHRYDIFQYIGCQATVYISVPAILLIWVPPLFFSVLTLIFASLALHHFIRRRITFAAHLQNSNSALTPNRYLRLIAMAITEIIWGTSFTTLNLWNNVLGGLRPYTNWADVHSGFSRVALFPAILLPPRFISMMMLLWTTMPVSAFIFFVFFGFGEEAKKEYTKLWAWIRRNVLRRKDSEKAKMIPLSGSSHQKFPKPLRTPPAYTASSTNSSFPRTPIKRDPDSFSISTLSYYGGAIDSAPAPEHESSRVMVRVGLPATPRPMYSLNAPNANPSTRSCPSTFPRSIGSTESLPACIQISPASSPSHSPSSSYENLTITTSDSHYATAPSSGSFLTTKPSTTFTLRSIPSVERIYLVSSPSGSRPQRVRSLTPAPFSDLQEIPSEPEEDERSFYSQSQSQSQSTVSSRRPSLTEDGHDDETVQCEDRPHVDVMGALGHSNTPSYSQRGLMDAIRVTVHTETRHGA
ncbi:hypothetical protein PC9H_011797 [Pleurotus ostreatus]|uniref:Uncharacterized protein n=1 Tax=Pleurotus ostreatus TaxID=5322 RepID=A0A8H6ZM51_PLEOS|nr:uncharacterized protein PC9H_011797 [Pleurotus ostreatus]KAF7421275.1 hypothetical protein PC9H_011797 [Pleurotus ostreatus]